MGKIEITVCDICGEERRSDSKKEYHWSDTIGEVLLTFKNHAGSQRVPFNGIMCTRCAKEIESFITRMIEKMKTTKVIKENNNE